MLGPLRRIKRHHVVAPNLKFRKFEILAIDDEMVVELLRDLVFYEYVPSMTPLRRELIRLQSHLAKIRHTSRSGHWDALRKELLPLVHKFYAILPAEGYDQIKKYLMERRRVEVTTLVFSESPY